MTVTRSGSWMPRANPPAWDVCHVCTPSMCAFEYSGHQKQFLKYSCRISRLWLKWCHQAWILPHQTRNVHRIFPALFFSYSTHQSWKRVRSYISSILGLKNRDFDRVMASTREISLLDGGQMTQSYVDSRGIRKQNLEGVRRANRSNESGEEVFDYGPNKFTFTSPSWSCGPSQSWQSRLPRSLVWVFPRFVGSNSVLQFMEATLTSALTHQRILGDLWFLHLVSTGTCRSDQEKCPTSNCWKNEASSCALSNESSDGSEAMTKNHRKKGA